MMRRIAAAALLVVLPVITAGAQDGRESSDGVASLRRFDSLRSDVAVRRNAVTRPRVEFDAAVVVAALHQSDGDGASRARHAIYGVVGGGVLGGVVGTIASNACRGGLCQDQRVSVALAAAGIGAFIGAFVGWFLPADVR